jgi:sRNA-binding protein
MLEDEDVISRDDIIATIELLCERFPRTFFQYERRRVPLKVGISDDVAAVLGDAIDRGLLGAALGFYTHNLFYRKAQKAGVPRIDLDGNPAGSVSKPMLRAPQRMSWRGTNASVCRLRLRHLKRKHQHLRRRLRSSGRTVLRACGKPQSVGSKQPASLKAPLMRPIRASYQLPVRANTMNREASR